MPAEFVDRAELSDRVIRQVKQEERPADKPKVGAGRGVGELIYFDLV